MLYQLVVEIEPDDVGYHFVLIDAEDDSVVRVGLTHAKPEDALRDAEDYLDSLENHAQENAMYTQTHYNPHHEATGESYAVEVQTAAGKLRVAAWTLDEASELRDSILDVGLSCRIIGMPTTLAAAGFFEDVGDRATLPNIRD